MSVKQVTEFAKNARDMVCRSSQEACAATGELLESLGDEVRYRSTGPWYALYRMKRENALTAFGLTALLGVGLGSLAGCPLVPMFMMLAAIPVELHLAGSTIKTLGHGLRKLSGTSAKSAPAAPAP
jgi:hypothetical protein